MEIYIGTGGYSNDDWLGMLYPHGTRPGEYLRLYSERFNAVELNASFYAIPGIRAFEGMLEKSRGRTRMSVKLHRSITHDRDANDDTYARLLESVEPLRSAGMLGPFLAQFPYSFHRTPENRRYLLEVTERFAGHALAVEFRGSDWDTDEVREAFRERGLTYVSVDYPQLSGLPRWALHVTADVAYVRLHGRNRETWWKGQSASERHDYLYTPDEMREIALEIASARDRVTQVYVFFQNTTRGHALKNAPQLRHHLEELGLDVTDVPPEG